MPPSTPPPSFIPREAPQMGESRSTGGNALADLFILIAVVLFVASVALAAGVFLYEQYITTSSASKVEQLNRAKAAFEPALIQELTRLDDRMRAAGSVLGSHLAPSVFFSMLQSTTITTVAFRSLDIEATDPQHITVRMDGVADSVNSIALQADLFAKGGMITSPIFSNINRESDGVHFALSGIMNPSAINFTQLVTNALAAAQQQIQQPEQGTPFGGAPQSGDAATLPGQENGAQQ